MADFPARHIGPDETDEAAMLRAIGVGTLDELAAETVPTDIRFEGVLDLPAPVSEAEVLAELRALAAENEIWKSFIGLGYSDCVTPPVIQRNILENPGWYTAYTPYQPEISQGRLEALINYQTMVADLTGLPIANASLLDEGTAAAEAMHMLHALAPALEKDDAPGGTFLISDTVHPQTIEVVRTRAKPLGIEVWVGDATSFDFSPGQRVFGVLVQYPATDGALPDWRDLCKRAHDAGALVAMATDLLALTLITPPGEIGADVAIGSAQRFGVPLGYGGPHAAFLATRSEWVRKLPGRLIGVSQDAHGHVAYRMALQTREQHIRREKATSNICTAQVLLAVIAGMYAVYHGPKGLRAIAERIGRLTGTLALGLEKAGIRVKHRRFFDTIRVDGSAADVERWHKAAAERRFNLRRLSNTAVTIS
ncbi:MAG TPA: glycine dehydrogenase (aminomethyl-transferring), partial [Polyangia bacterium]|nr:glycine dehydrogenase (aminomethyl-transferring) [Polyangia bacterium]